MAWAWFVSGLTSGVVLWSLLNGANKRFREHREERKDLSAIIYSGIDSAGNQRPGLLEQLRKIEGKIDALSGKSGE